MRFLRVTTPTCLDIREIVTLGMTTKANTDKIGHKGSGLKFTLAYLHRLGGCLQARSVDYHLRSELFTARIREVDHQMIRLKSEEGEQIWEAHITTQAGADTWTEPWFILREMLQNAIDEGGQFGVVGEDALPETGEPVPGYEIEASLNSASTSLLVERLAGTSQPLPMAETLLADAPYFLGLAPPDYQRAVLIAAIACEVKVRDTLRQKISPDRLPLVELILANPRDWSVAAVALIDKAMAAALGRSLKADDREMYRSICKLFEIRNGIAHRGEEPERNEARRVLLAARQVFRWLDES